MDEVAQLLEGAVRQSFGRMRRDRETAPEELRPLLAYVEEHLFDPTTTATRLGELFGADRVSRLPQHLGASVPVYVEDRRMEIACNLLDGTELKIREVAERLGYSSVQVFSRAFSRWAGERPSAYRDRDRTRLPAWAAAFAELREVESNRAEEAWRNLAIRSPEEQLELMERLRFDEPGLADLLRRRSREACRDDPRHAVHLARLAVAAAESLRGEKRRNRHQALSWAELAHACREAKDLDEASRAISVAEAWAAGTSLSDAERSGLLKLKANLLRDLGQASKALVVIEAAIDAARETQDTALYADMLIAKAAIFSAAGDPSGIALVEEALALLREVQGDSSAERAARTSSRNFSRT